MRLRRGIWRKRKEKKEIKPWRRPEGLGWHYWRIILFFIDLGWDSAIYEYPASLIPPDDDDFDLLEDVTTAFLRGFEYDDELQYDMFYFLWNDSILQRRDRYLKLLNKIPERFYYRIDSGLIWLRSYLELRKHPLADKVSQLWDAWAAKDWERYLDILFDIRKRLKNYYARVFLSLRDGEK